MLELVSVQHLDFSDLCAHLLSVTYICSLHSFTTLNSTWHVGWQFCVQ